MRGFIVVEDSFPIEVGNLADAITQIMQLTGINGTAHWYFDDDNIDRGTEHGVMIEINGVSPDVAINQMKHIWQICVEQNDGREIYLEIPQQ